MKILKVLTGQVLFKEGTHGKHLMYLIKEGKMEISIYRGDKKIVLASLSKGQFFGELDLLSTDPRSTTAQAVTYCELQVLDVEVLSKHFDHSPPLLRHILRALIVTVKSRNEMVARQGHEQPVISSYAHLIEMMSFAQKTSSTLRNSRTTENSLPVSAVLEKCKKVFGHHKDQTMTILRQMAKLKLITLDMGSSYQNIVFNANEIIARATHLPDEVSTEVLAQIQSEQEHIDLDELAELIGVDRQTLLRKISLDSISEEVFLIRKSVALRYVTEKGRGYFSKQKKLSADEINDLNDLEFISQDILSKALSKMETIELAKLLKPAKNNSFQVRVYALMGRAQKEDLSDLLSDIKENALESEAMEEKFIYIIQQLLQTSSVV